jgi:hypothetical protein
MGWDGIADAMADECWPATHEERKTFLEQNWDEIPSQVQTDQIEDEDIRASTYFLGEVPVSKYILLLLTITIINILQ